VPSEAGPDGEHATASRPRLQRAGGSVVFVLGAADAVQLVVGRMVRRECEGKLSSSPGCAKWPRILPPVASAKHPSDANLPGCLAPSERCRDIVRLAAGFSHRR